MADGIGALALAPLAPFDAAAFRAEFPILARQIHGRPLVYLDNAASAQKPHAVIAAMTEAMTQSYANVHRGIHTLANETTQRFEAARASIARFLNAPAPENIVFTRGSTEAINLVANGFAEFIQPGDEILLTEMEHHSNIVPWHFLRERHGAVLRWAPVRDDGALDMEAFARLLSPRTKLVAVTHMSNVLGTVTDAAAIAALAHDVGAAVLFDGSQAAVHLPVNVRAIDADFYVATGHKLYGPSGIGFLYGKAEWLTCLRPYQGGGEMIESVAQDRITYAEPPHKFEAGTPPILEAIGLGAAIEQLRALDRPGALTHEEALYARAADGLRSIPGAKIIGEAPCKGAILAFTLDGAHAHDIAQILDKYGVAIRAGQHCAEPLMRRFGVTSSARASFAPYNTFEEVDAFLDALGRARKLLS